MKRRQFIGGLGLAATAAACSQEPAGNAGTNASSSKTFRWNMVTSWPPKLPGAGLGVDRLAQSIEEASGGRLKIKVFAGGELVPPLEVFDAVRSGAAQMGHDAAYYHRGKVPAAQYMTAVPFGLNANEINAWFYHGGALEMWQEYYDQYGLMVFPAGNTGVQMMGWFNKEINSPDDLRGLKIRMPGLGGEVIQRTGAVQVTVAGSEIFTALQTGAIDAAEWIGPYNDLSLGLNKAAKYYYYPGWHEPGPALQCTINKEAWLELPEDLQAIVRNACMAANMDIQAEYTHGNAIALEQLMQDPDIELRELPPSVIELLREESEKAVAELVAADEWAARFDESFRAFVAKSNENQKISELSYLQNRIGT